MNNLCSENKGADQLPAQLHPSYQYIIYIKSFQGLSAHNFTTSKSLPDLNFQPNIKTNFDIIHLQGLWTKPVSVHKLTKTSILSWPLPCILNAIRP